MSEERISQNIWGINIKMGKEVSVDADTVDSLIHALEEAISVCVKLYAPEETVSDSRELALVCHLGRELVKAVWLSRSSELWTDDRMKKSVHLLNQAAVISKGSKYGRNSATRSEAFTDALTRLQDEDKAWAPLRKAMLDTGETIPSVR